MSEPATDIDRPHQPTQSPPSAVPPSRRADARPMAGGRRHHRDVAAARRSLRLSP
ncbi:hypothetical protein NKG94_08925 [Micromonospora sp. M12]